MRLFQRLTNPSDYELKLALNRNLEDLRQALERERKRAENAEDRVKNLESALVKLQERAMRTAPKSISSLRGSDEALTEKLERESVERLKKEANETAS